MNSKMKIKNQITYIYQAKRGRKRYNAQMATTYILYMMLGSAFKKCIFASSSMEDRLRFEYMKMPAADQYETEDKIIDWMEKTIAIQACEDIWCKVFTYQEGECMGIRFETYVGAIEVLVDERGDAFQRIKNVNKRCMNP